MTDFKHRLQKLMDEYNYQAVDIVNKSNGYITKSNLSQWLKGLCEPSSKKISVLADIFGCNPNYLLCLTDDPSPVNIETLTNEAKLCDLMSKCYGSESYKIVKMYMSLNDDGKKAAFERIQELTQLEKYTVKRDTVLQKKEIS